MTLPINPALTAAGLLDVPWFVVDDDEVGGWALSNVDLPASRQDVNLGHRQLAWFVHREHAELVARWHHAHLKETAREDPSSSS